MALGVASLSELPLSTQPTAAGGNDTGAFSSDGTSTASAVGASQATASGSSAGVATAQATGISNAQAVFGADGLATVDGIGTYTGTVEAVFSSVGVATVLGIGSSTGGQPDAVVGGWSWPVDPARRKKKPIENEWLRPEIEKIFAKVVHGVEEAPETAPLAQAAVKVVAPYTTNGVVNWAEFETHRRELAQLKFLLDQYLDFLADEEETDELLLLS